MPSAATRSMKILQEGSYSCRKYPVAASQTIYKGDLVVLDANGKITLAAAASANIGAASGTANQLYIINQDAVSLAADTDVEVIAINDTTQLIMPLTTNGSAQAFAQAQVGDAYEIRNVGGKFMVDVNANTNAKVVVVARDPNTPAADTWGMVIVAPIAGQWGK